MSVYSDSFRNTSYSNAYVPDISTPGRPALDFIDLITLVSDIYAKRRYIEMQNLDYENAKDIGRGGMYRVFAVRIKFESLSKVQQGATVNKEKNVAVKAALSFGNKALHYIIHELRILDHDPLYHHPNIVKLKGIGWHFHQFNQGPALENSIRSRAEPRVLLEEADETLQEFLNKYPKFPFSRKLRILLEVVSGLLAVHQCGIIHGDIKPDNVLMFGHTAKLADFSHSIIDMGSVTSVPEATAGYGAPECKGAISPVYAKATDIYSLGILFWQVLFLDAPKFPSGMGDMSSEADTYSQVMLEVERHFQLTAHPRSYRFILESLFQNTLQTNPQDRALRPIMESLISAIASYDEITSTPPSLINTPRLQVLGKVNAPRIYISYQNFRAVSSVVKDQIVHALIIIANDPHDPRSPRAMYELGICSLAEFGVPEGGARWSAGAGTLPDHLHYFVKSAHAGELAAQAILNRIFSATLDRRPPSAVEPFITPWLQNAAINGSAVAAEDLAATNPTIYRHSMNRRASRNYENEFAFDPSEKFSHQLDSRIDRLLASRGGINHYRMNNRGDSLLHWAVACGHLNWVKHLRAKFKNIDVNRKNDDGYTPLVLGCYSDQYETVLYLLSLPQVDVNLCTNLGETALHFTWCFSNENQAAKIVRALARREIDFQIEAQKSTNRDGFASLATGLDPLPVLPGLAIERVAARNRAQLVHLLFELGPEITPCDGNLTRQMTIWSMRLGHVEMLWLLRQFSRHGYAGIDIERGNHTQPPDTPAEISWEFEGKVLGLGHALAVGWVSGIGDGWDTPVEYWRRCCKGARWHSNMCSIINNHEEFRYSHSILDWAFRRGRIDFVDVLLENRLGDILSQTAHDPSSALQIITNSSNLKPIDCIIYKGNEGTVTLAQRAILQGDRAVFKLLVEKYNPDLRRPSWKMNPSFDSYSLVSIAGHFDIWFAQWLMDLEIPIKPVPHEYREFNPLDKPRFPPLYHAISLGFYGLARLIVTHGADIEQAIGKRDVLHEVLRLHVIRADTIRYLFVDPDAPNVPRKFKQERFHVFNLVYVCVRGYQHGLPETRRQDQHSYFELEQTWLYMLKAFPGVRNSPWLMWGCVVPFKPCSILFQASDLYSSAPSLLSQYASDYLGDFDNSKTALETVRMLEENQNLAAPNIVFGRWKKTELDLWKNKPHHQIYKLLYSAGFRHSLWLSLEPWALFAAVCLMISFLLLKVDTGFTRTLSPSFNIFSYLWDGWGAVL